MITVSLVTMNEAAKRMGVSRWSARRRLKKLNDRVGGGILVRFHPEGDLYADAAMLKRFLPGLLTNEDEDPLERANQKLDRLLEVTEDIQIKVTV